MLYAQTYAQSADSYVTHATDCNTFFQCCVTHYENDGSTYIHATMLKLVQLYIVTHCHRYTMTRKGGQPFAYARLPLTLFHMTGRTCTRPRNHYFPALASPRGHWDATVCVFQSALQPADDSMHDRSQLPGRIYNVQYERDVHYAMQLCRWILKPIGIWRLISDRSSQSEKLLSLMLILTCFSGLCFVLVPAGSYTLFREKDINVKVKLFGPIGFCLTSAIKYCFLGARVSAIGRCVKHVESDWRVVRHQDHRNMMLRNALVGRRLTTLCVLFLYSGGMSYHAIMPLFAKTKTNDSLTIRPLVYPGYDAYFDSQASPTYEIIFTLHCVSAMIQYSATTAACSLAAIFTTHACGQVQILMTLLNDLVDGKRTKGTVEKRLNLLARHHVRVLRWDLENRGSAGIVYTTRF